MALLPILEYPDARLKRIASPVTEFTPAIKKLVNDMAETMYAAPGIGLAATQVDVHKRVIVIDVSQDKSDLKVFINPEIIEADGEIVGEEGCLSVPQYYDNVRRAAHVKVRAQDASGTPFELEATELLAVCIQHEMDHLKGIVFVDHLSQLKQMRVKSKMIKRHREAARA
ncbi:MAG TPA: peptide deformylase [Casimicrobium huifangae]|jgi:peptide deformylase|uniref:peptide deformylase n=1 Tax=Casimicrobium huifangae TaxID=2591109 RepID=UPI0012EB12E6|nr:peptide deformylase [Casimicrobium huifangae]HOB00063.1 peptide deformylase [Casimicrobium huifangae]HQA32382.1 peptide deformylase [Casimicrobium huifangae]HQD63997.1 peptide deformylase [Casimicrobium huifangae]